MKNLSFDPELIDQAHDFWRWRIDAKLADPTQRYSRKGLIKEMQRRGMSFIQAMGKEVPTSLMHELVLAHRIDLGRLFDPTSPELSDYEAARFGSLAISSSHTVEATDARHVAAYRSEEYTSLLDAADRLSLAPHRHFVRGEILTTMGKHEIVSRLVSSGRDPLPFDLKAISHEAIGAYQKAIADGVALCR